VEPQHQRIDGATGFGVVLPCDVGVADGGLYVNGGFYFQIISSQRRAGDPGLRIRIPRTPFRLRLLRTQ
jgi:hypothetical protein